MQYLSWPAIVRLGLVQTSLGAIIVLTTSTINRVMVVELALPAMLPGFLVALHHFVQMSRPRFGYGSDKGGRHIPWIMGGMGVLATGGILAAVATAVMTVSTSLGVSVAVFAFLMIGLGVGAAGTSLLALLAKRVAPQRRPAAATLVWIMMIAGFAVTASVAGQFLDPFSPARLIWVTSVVSIGAFALTCLAVRGLERAPAPETVLAPTGDAALADKMPDFKAALREIWQERQARQFTLFVFVSMVAYSAQDLILEPYAGLVFGMTPGESTQLAGIQHGGVLLGMLLVAASGTVARTASYRLLRWWTVGGCLASGIALLGIAYAGKNVEEWPLTGNVFVLGVANGAFAVAAIASMMTLAGQGTKRREGLRMGLWGAAQAIAFALGGFLGTVAVDVMRLLMEQPAAAYATVFTVEAGLFLVAALLGATIHDRRREATEASGIAFTEVAMNEVFQKR
ncbi:MAG: BCD family MFS transporter [Pseudomonadota bacterium]